MNDHDLNLQDSSADEFAPRGEEPQGAFPLGELCWSVGRRNPSSILQCNTYIRRFEGGGHPQVNVCVDPGSQYDYAHVEANINGLLGDVGEIHSMSLNHQDPDVIGNASLLLEANPNASIMVTEEVWRLAQHLLLSPSRVHFANAARSQLTIIGDRHRWQLAPTPFCHFRGAMAFYDPELRTLFSGDLFGGLNRPGRIDLMAEEDDWHGIAQFHQIYMPSREGLRYAIRQIEALDPPVEVIAPQHGFIITGDLVKLFMERLYDLPVGLDLLATELDETYLDGYRRVVARLIGKAADLMGYEEAVARLTSSDIDDGLDRLITLHHEAVEVDRQGYDVVVKAFARLAAREPIETKNALRSEAMAACLEEGVPIPPVGAGIESDVQAQSIGPDGIRTQAWWMR